MDALLHPGADGGLDLPSLLSWQYDPEKEIPHVVLGKADIGGAWQVMYIYISFLTSKFFTSAQILL